MVIVRLRPPGFQSLRPHPARIQTILSAHFPVLVRAIPATPERHSEKCSTRLTRPDGHDVEATCAVARGRVAATFHVVQSHCSATNVRMRRDGPPRMEGRSTWSGRERSSHSRFPPVPRVGLVTFYFLPAVSSRFSVVSPRSIPPDFRHAGGVRPSPWFWSCMGPRIVVRMRPARRVCVHDIGARQGVRARPVESPVHSGDADTISG